MAQKEKGRREVRLSEEEVKRIKSVIRDKDTSRTIKCRAQILLLADKEHGKTLTQQQIAKQIGVSPSTVSLAIRKYVEEGLENTLTFAYNPATNAARQKVDGGLEALIVATACSDPPEGRARWTVRLLTEEVNKVSKVPIGKTAVHRALERNCLRPHKSKYWCVLPSEEKAKEKFIKRMEEVLDIYCATHEDGTVLVCMDEKSVKLHDEVRMPRKMKPGSKDEPDNKGHDKRVDAEYARCGTACIFHFVEPNTGKVHTAVRRHRTAIDWAIEIQYLLNFVYPDAKKVILVLDNLNVHSLKSLEKAFSKEVAAGLASRLELHFTPVHGSWLNMAEGALSVLSRQVLLGRRIPDIHQLVSETDAWVADRNARKIKIHWKFTKEDARTKLACLYPKEIPAA